MLNTSATVIIISGPSSVGKSKVIRRIASRFGCYRFIVSYTTRPQRKDEINGRDYFFIGESDFAGMISGGEFLQWKKSPYGLYGTSLKQISEAVDSGCIPLLDLDVDSFILLKSMNFHVIGVFLLPDSMETLKGRIYSRGPDRGVFCRKDADIRLEASVNSIRYSFMYDYIIENTDEEETALIINKACESDTVRKGKSELFRKWTCILNEEGRR
jgi:guanylate kinase